VTRAARRVGVVAAELEGERTGVGRVLEGLLEGVLELPLDWQWRLFFQGHPFDHPLWADPRFVPVFSGRAGSRVAWEQLVLPLALTRHRLDLLYSPAYSLPPWRGPRVVSLHDLSFERLPEEFAPRERWRRRLLARWAAHRAARVLVDTGRVRREVVDLYRLDPGRVGVLPLPVDPRFRPAAAAEVERDLEALAGLGVEPPYLLHAGTLLDRRCLPLVLQTFARLAPERPGLTLVLAGADRLRDRCRLQREADATGMADRVRHLGWVADRVLPALYRHAELSLYLSTYEGFGLPPLESLACGTPVVVHGAPGLDELWPDYPLRCRRLDAESVEAAARAALAASSRALVAAEARVRLRGLTPVAAARALVAELERV
jgi:glycosyltransferase involved in cell wall biosynthesis